MICLCKATVQFLILFNSYLKVICNLYISIELTLLICYVLENMMEFPLQLKLSINERSVK